MSYKAGLLDDTSNFDLGAKDDLNMSSALLYTDEKKKMINARMSKRINEELLINDNPHIYPGYIESLPGQFIDKRPSQSIKVTESYVVSDPKIETDYYIYTITGLDFKTCNQL
jgi:hypothetical protein